MKKLILLAVLMALTLTACKEKDKEIVPDAPDYTQAYEWYITDRGSDFDLFYICSTSTFDYKKDGATVHFSWATDTAACHGIYEEMIGVDGILPGDLNFYSPFYRQITMETYLDTALISSRFPLTMEDVTAAFNYYIENYNHGRPFVLAGFSQGGQALVELLKQLPEELNERMVAAYVIGYSVTKDDLEANPHLKFATGESDTGVIISWNTEGPKNIEQNAPNVVVLPGAISINPLNWKTDETYAPASENLGSLVPDEKTGEPVIGDAGADAQINLARGVVVTNAPSEPVDESVIPFFGPDARHGNDYPYYYNNIKDNVAKRIAAYKASH